MRTSPCTFKVLVFVLLAGCEGSTPQSISHNVGSNKPSPESAGTVDRVPQSASDSQEPRLNDDWVEELLQKEAKRTNVYSRFPTKDRLPRISPEVEQQEASINLLNLGIALRSISLPEAIGEVSAIYFSETQVTNHSFAIFLGDTNQFRDDKAIQRAAQEPAFSTISPSIKISDRGALWNDGNIPPNRELHPVSLLTIHQAMEFCDWLNERYHLAGHFRLPTHDEWLFAAYGVARQFPWGDDQQTWQGTSTEPVTARPALRTPDGLYGMWGNVSEFVLSPWDGYGHRIRDPYSPFISAWLGTSYQEDNIHGRPTHARQDDWGYTHSRDTRSDRIGFRVVFVPKKSDAP